MLRCGIVLKPSTLLHFHHVLTKRKYHLLFSSKRTVRPGPKGPAQELIDAVVEMKRRNPTWGCPRIAQQITFVLLGYSAEPEFCLSSSEFTAVAVPQALVSQLVLAGVADGRTHR